MKTSLLNYLSPQASQSLAKEKLGRLIARASGALWQPLPGPQTSALYTEAYELFYGGAAGGGKTDLTLGLSLTQHRRSIIFRRIYKNLRAIIDRSIEIVGHKDGLNQSLYIWRNLPGNRMIEFGAMEQENDKFSYKGNPHDLYVFDEAPDFTESQITFVTGWARTTLPNQRVRVVYTGNPPTTAEGEWIIRRFAPWLDPQHGNPAAPGELRWYAQVDGKEVEVESGAPFTHKGEQIQPRSRTFIPARLTDNPFLMATEYGTNLQALPEPLRSQLLYGDFSIKAHDDPWQVIPTKWIQLAQKRWELIDHPAVALRSIGVDVSRGGKDFTAIAPLYGTYFEPVQKFSGEQTPDGDSVAALVAQADTGAKTPIFVDVIGIGASAYDSMIRQGMAANPINFGAAATTRDKTERFGFANVRAESYWKLREALDPESGEDIALPPDREVLVDLAAARYSLTGGRYLVEPKEDIQKRIGRSPDMGDAIALAWRCTISSEAAIYVGTKRVG